MGFREFDRYLVVILALIGIIYVGSAWSPSSYGYVLKLSKSPNHGIIWGEPRAIRSDEWSVTTPLTQAIVRNNFERYNKTSYYEEDLRINYSLPIKDWGLIFKPTYWLYLALPPAYAFSFHYWAMFALFILGYFNLFRTAGCKNSDALLFSLSIYFTGFIQFFWGSNTTLFVYFPWLIIILISEINFVKKLIIYYWVGVSWLIGNFYPPFFISLAIFGIIFLWAYKPKLFELKTIAPILLVTVLAILTTVIYLWEYLQQTITTFYPGQRISQAGYYPWEIFWTQFWPSVLFDMNFEPSVNYTNVAGVGVIGLYWTLAFICFADWTSSDIKQLLLDRKQQILFVGYLITLAWLFLPIPELIGKITFLDRVPPERMIFVSGLMMLFNLINIFIHVKIAKGNLVIRFLIYSLLVLIGWFLFGKWTSSISSYEDHLFEFLGPIFLGLFLIFACKFNWNKRTTLIAACLLANIVVFGRFNPIQSSKAIFDTSQNFVSNTLKNFVNKEGILIAQRPEFLGAVLNGMGFKAISHINAVPQIKKWEEKFDTNNGFDFNVFNRYAHIRINPSVQPKLLENDQIGIPSASVREQPKVIVSNQTPSSVEMGGGHIDNTKIDKDKVTYQGWANWTGYGGNRELLIVSNTKFEFVIADQERWDVVAATGRPELLLSGFNLEIYHNNTTLGVPQLFFYARSNKNEQWKKLSISFENKEEN